jgi:hypothetical protein
MSFKDAASITVSERQRMKVRMILFTGRDRKGSRCDILYVLVD